MLAASRLGRVEWSPIRQHRLKSIEQALFRIWCSLELAELSARSSNATSAK